jgi:hypothetical protein
MSFSQLNNETQINRLTTPMLVSVSQNPDSETKEMITKRHGRFLKLPEKTKDKLASVLTSQKIQSIGRKYAFDLLRLANITRLVREYYFGEVRLEDFPREIERRMGVSLLTAQEIARYLKTEIIDWDPWAEYLASLPKASAREILTRFPKVAEQEITGGFLELKGSEDIFEPTIRNWLRDYVQHLGQERHSNIDRMNYLFHTENTRSLLSTDREKLGIILRSFDENTPLAVDLENNEVVFDISETPANKGSTFSLSDKSSNSSRSNLGQKPVSENFIKPYPPISRSAGPVADKFSTETKPPAPPKNIQQKAPDTRYQIPDTIKFTNPYPAPGTHEVGGQAEMAGEAPVKMKGFSEGVSRDSQGSASPPRHDVGVPQSRTFSDTAKPYVPSRPKNIIYPRSQRRKEEMPEPRINGNLVDLRGDNE